MNSFDLRCEDVTCMYVYVRMYACMYSMYVHMYACMYVWYRTHAMSHSQANFEQALVLLPASTRITKHECSVAIVLPVLVVM